MTGDQDLQRIPHQRCENRRVGNSRTFCQFKRKSKRVNKRPQTFTDGLVEF